MHDVALARMPAAKSARAGAESSPRPSGSKIGPGDMNTARWPPGAVTCEAAERRSCPASPCSDDLRSTGSLASAAREVTDRRIDAAKVLRPPGRAWRARGESAAVELSRSRVAWVASLGLVVVFFSSHAPPLIRGQASAGVAKSGLPARTAGR